MALNRRACHHRQIAALDPEFLAVLGQPLEFAGHRLAAGQLLPDIVHRPALAGGIIGQEGVGLSDNLARRIARQGQDLRIGFDHMPVDIEFDHQAGLRERINNQRCF